MITWMQNNHRYLVVTIWISVIAFVGAGFVGWGSYDYSSSKGNSVISVEDTFISVDEFQREYSIEISNIKKEYPNVSDSEIKNSRLDQSVLNKLTNRAILLQYAKEKGLISTKREIKSILKNTQSFQKDGLFDKETYYNYLKAIRMIAKDYEKSLEANVILQKLLKALELPVLAFEKEAFKSILSMQDKLEIEVIHKNDIDLSLSEAEIKKYWEDNKEQYKSLKNYSLKVYELDIEKIKIEEKEIKEYWSSHKLSFKNTTGKLKSFEEAKEEVENKLIVKANKTKALLKRLELQKEKELFSKNITIDINNQDFPIGSFISKKINKIFKPIQIDDKFVIFKLISINKPEILEYNIAKENAKKHLLVTSTAIRLKQIANTKLNTFTGEDIGFAGRESKINNLSDNESLELLNYIFNSSSKIGYKVFNDKVVLYKVLEQKLLNKSNSVELDLLIDQSVKGIKNSLVLQGLINELKNKYKIINFYQGK